MSKVECHYLTLEETAEVLRCSPDLVAAAIDSGVLPAKRLGTTHRSSRILKTDVIPDPHAASNLRFHRLRQLQRTAQRLREEALSKEAEARAAREAADRAVQDVSDALDLELVFERERLTA